MSKKNRTGSTKHKACTCGFNRWKTIAKHAQVWGRGARDVECRNCGAVRHWEW